MQSYVISIIGLLVRACSKRYHGHAATYFEVKAALFCGEFNAAGIGFYAKNAGLPKRGGRPEGCGARRPSSPRNPPAHAAAGMPSQITGQIQPPLIRGMAAGAFRAGSKWLRQMRPAAAFGLNARRHKRLNTDHISGAHPAQGRPSPMRTPSGIRDRARPPHT